MEKLLNITLILLEIFNVFSFIKTVLFLL